MLKNLSRVRVMERDMTELSNPPKTNEPVSVEVEALDKTFIGTVDAMVVTGGLTLFAVMPTFLAAVFAPWKLSPLLAGNHVDGRKGLMLGPGIYFVVTTLLMLFLISTSSGTIDPASEEASAIEHQVREALMSGDLQGATVAILPFYAAALVVGFVGIIILKLAGPLWTTRVSIGAGLYALSTIMTLVVSVILLSEQDLGLPTDIVDVVLPLLAVLGSVFLMPWQYTQFLRTRAGVGAWKAVGLSILVTIASLIAGIIALALLPE